MERLWFINHSNSPGFTGSDVTMALRKAEVDPSLLGKSDYGGLWRVGFTMGASQIRGREKVRQAQKKKKGKKKSANKSIVNLIYFSFIKNLPLSPIVGEPAIRRSLFFSWQVGVGGGGRSGERSKKAQSSTPPAPPPHLFALAPIRTHPNWKSALFLKFCGRLLRGTGG